MEFARQWRESEERAEVRRGVEEFERRWGGEGGEEGEGAKDFRRSRDAMQAGGMYVLFHLPFFFLLTFLFTLLDKHRSVNSPYTLSFPMQIKLCTWRGMRRLKGDLTTFYSMVFGNFVMALVIGARSLFACPF